MQRMSGSRIETGGKPCIPESKQGSAQVYDHIVGLMDAAFRMSDIERLRARCDGPLVIKGVLDGGLAEQLFAVGADAIQVSNHGGTSTRRCTR
jgi:isopentenyl diphosphate isomerase/L-lactate dehydrogenase-like FMN-dependent dehydrogenase